MIADRRVKIVATIGPATSSLVALKKCVEAGMDVARLNFSHGSHDDHLLVIQNLRQISGELKAPIAILQDLQGPKIRVGKLKNGSVELEPGQQVILSPAFTEGEGSNIPTDFRELPRVCEPGQKILLDDGLMELRVLSKQDDQVVCEVIYGGLLKERKGINIPGASLPIECMTPKDLKDLEFGLNNKVDYIALSFVRHGDDIRKLRHLIERKGLDTRIVAKIEMLEALQNLEDIVRLSDAVMVARGDLAVEVGQPSLPGYQKTIIRLSNRLGKPVITATQMLDSMVEKISPTRAEITDVANAVLDGSDALMLSAESASGKYPIKCIETMAAIIREVERTGTYYYNMKLSEEFLSDAESIAVSACLTAMKLNASAIVCLTTTGKTATMISSYRPKAKVIAVTDYLPTLNKLELIWGIQGLAIQPYATAEEAMEQVERLLLEYGVVRTGERVVLTLGMPVKDKPKTNSLRIYTIGGESILRLGIEQLPLRWR